MSVCPFCGVITPTPHENQLGCLEALAAEIARLRHVLEHSQPAPAPVHFNPPEDGPDDN
jgi:hypothetical protein